MMAEQTLSILDLRDIVIPEPVGLWPPAPFVWMFFGALCLGLAALIWRWVARWRAGAYRREGLAFLSQIEGRLSAQGGEAAALSDLSILLKRVALAAFPRRQVASLCGENWLKFLDSSCQDVHFTGSPGRLLASAMTATPDTIQISTDDCIKLVALTRAWIKNHRGPNTGASSVG